MAVNRLTGRQRHRSPSQNLSLTFIYDMVSKCFENSPVKLPWANSFDTAVSHNVIFWGNCDSERLKLRSAVRLFVSFCAYCLKRETSGWAQLSSSAKSCRTSFFFFFPSVFFVWPTLTGGRMRRLPPGDTVMLCQEDNCALRLFFLSFSVCLSLRARKINVYKVSVRLRLSASSEPADYPDMWQVLVSD